MIDKKKKKLENWGLDLDKIINDNDWKTMRFYKDESQNTNRLERASSKNRIENNFN